MASTTKLLAIVEFDDEDVLKIENENCSSSLQYIYRPLPSKGDHLRLIELAAGEFHESVHVSITTYTLDSTVDKPPYNAVSYTWNDSEYDRLIVQGKRVSESSPFRSKYSVRHPLWVGEKRILISTNLRDALRRFRDPKRPVTLWIDALCINQSDFDERAAQVMTMQRIYHSAERVFLWLGEEGNHSAEAIKLIQQFRRIGAAALAGKVALPNRSGLYDPKVWMRFKLPPFPDSPSWAGVMKIFSRPVFHRIWIVQELVAARKAEVYCGSSDPFEYRIFEEALGFLQRSGWIYTLDTVLAGGQNKISSFIAVSAIRSIWIKNPTIELRKKQRQALVERTRRFEATDPRDKVFAFLPLINDYGHRDLHGVDAPAEMRSSNPHRKREGPLDRLLNSLVQEEADEDALDILRRSVDPTIANVRRGLDQFLCFAPKILAPFLSPTSYSAEACRRLDLSLETETQTALAPILEFVSSHGMKSKQHREVVAYIDRFYKNIISRVETFSNLLGNPHIEVMVAMSNDQEYIEDIKALENQISTTLKQLRQELSGQEHEDDTHKTSIRDLLSQGKIVVGDTVGGLSDDMTAMNLGRQFLDWAWSPTGSNIPEYRKAVSDVYTEFTVKCIQDDNKLDILSAVEDSSVRKQEGLPSWVPDYSVTLERSPIYSTRDSEQALCAASGVTESDVKWSIDEPSLLKVKGYQFDKIKALSSLEGANAKRITTQPDEWASMIKDAPEKSPTGRWTKDAFWRTLIGDRVISQSGQTISPAPLDYGTFYSMALKVLQIRKALVDSHEAFLQMLEQEGMTEEQFQVWIQKHDLFFEAMAPVMLQRRLCITEQGYLGAVPSSARVGDSVFVLEGGPVPYILRYERSGDDRRFVFVGECYVHGIMKGEQYEKYMFEQITLV